MLVAHMQLPVPVSGAESAGGFQAISGEPTLRVGIAAKGTIHLSFISQPIPSISSNAYVGREEFPGVFSKTSLNLAQPDAVTSDFYYGTSRF